MWQINSTVASFAAENEEKSSTVGSVAKNVENTGFDSVIIRNRCTYLIEKRSRSGTESKLKVGSGSESKLKVGSGS